jgi:hypothetical protein
VLAYVFWHLPAPNVDVADYEARLAAFHAALRAERASGVELTATVALDAIPWLGGDPGYEDWYLVDDFAALGVLNAAAVSGARQAAHDAAAAAAHRGVAGVMGHVSGPLLPEPPRWAAWLSKPDGLSYEAFHAELWEALSNDASAWQRQMTLGPATEYCVVAPAEHTLPWPAQSWPLRSVVDPSG